MLTIETLIFAIAGLMAGLIPGIHMNTFSILAGQLADLISPEAMAIGLGAAFVAHAASSLLPAIFLGAPAESTALAVLPGHRMLLKGEGQTALHLSLWGLMLGSLFFLLLAPLAYYSLPKLAEPLSRNMGVILAAAAGYMMLGERELVKILQAVFIFLLAGLLGVVVLGMPLQEDTKLFTLLTGAFGLSGLFLGSISKGKLPAQKPVAEGPVTAFEKVVQPAAIGTLAGLLVGSLPAMSSSVSISAIGAFFSKTFWEEKILVAIGAANVTGFLFSTITFASIGRARNGTVHAISELAPSQVLLACAAGLFTVFFAVLATIFLSRKFTELFRRADYQLINRLSLAFLLLLVLINGGPVGLLIAITAAAIGLLPILLGISRANAMGLLLVPTILFYMGL